MGLRKDAAAAGRARFWRRAGAGACLAAALAPALCLAACAGAEPPAAGATSEDERVPLVYTADFEFAPYRVATDEGYFGYEIDVNNAIFSGTQYRLEYRFEDLAIDNLEALAKRQDIDIFGWRVITPATQQYMLLSDPVYEFNWGAVTRASLGAVGTEDLGRYKIGITHKKFPYNYLVTGMGLENYVIYTSYAEAAEALINGEVEVWFEEKEIANYYLTRASHYVPTQFHEATCVPVKVGLLIRPDLVDLHREINERIAAIKRDNQLESFYMRYFQKHSDEYIQRQETQSRNIALFSLGAVLVLCGVLVAIIRFTRKYMRMARVLAETNTSLQEATEQYTVAVEGSNDGILYYSDATGELVLSERYRAIIAWPEGAELTLERFFAHCAARYHAVHRPGIQAFTRFFEEKTVGVFTDEARTNDGISPTVWCAVRIKSQLQAGHWTVGGTISDITERKRVEAQTLFFARHDYLTKIYNRAYLFKLSEEILADARAKGDSFSVLYVDLDNFKTINDLYGHDYGDRALTEVVAAIQAALPRDAVFARVGGDEFVVVLRKQHDVDEICGRIIAGIRRINIRDVQIGASIGIAGFPAHGDSMEQLIIVADGASRQVKADGKNSWCRAKEEPGGP